MLMISHAKFDVRFNDVPPMPYYTLNTIKLQRLGLKFKPVDVMFDDTVASLEERGLLKRNIPASVNSPANELPKGTLLQNVEVAV